MDQYKEGTANFSRLKTDSLFINFDQRAKFTGCVEKATRLIHDEQLMNRTLWKRFVQQFRNRDDSEKGAWRGEYWGKMMRGACFVYAYTRDDGLLRVLEETMEDILTAEDDLGRISSFTPDRELFGWDVWCRKYVLLGMQYFLEISENEPLNRKLIDSMCRQADYLIEKIGPNPGQMSIYATSQTWQGLNSSTVLEPIVRLYGLTGAQKYLDFARYLIDCGGTALGNLIDLAVEDRLAPYQYPVTKAYEMMSYFEGVLEYYRITGEERCKTAVVNYGRRLMETDITIIGSAGCTHELLDHSAVRQSDPDSLAYNVMQETCVTVTWMKFCTQLLLLTGDAVFADQIEQSFYNAYLGAVNTENAMDEDPKREGWIPEPLTFDSYSPLLPGLRGRKIGGLQRMRDNHYYGCCACIGAAGIGLVSKVAALLCRDGVALGLYIPGTIAAKTPSGAPLRLDITTDYPTAGEVRIAVLPAEEERFALLLRIPGWCRKASVSLNGGEDEPGAPGFFRLERSWKAGDTVTLHLEMETCVLRPIPYGTDTLNIDHDHKTDVIRPVEVKESPENHGHIAFRRGPLMLAIDARTGTDPDAAIDPVLEGDTAPAAPLSADAVPFPVNLAVALPLRDGGTLTLVDYASAGKTMREDSRMAAWLTLRQ